MTDKTSFRSRPVIRPRRMEVWACGLLLIAVMPALAADWTHWRGASQNGSSAEQGLPSTWSKDGENLLWHAAMGCRSTPLILNGRVYMINRAGEGEHRKERVVALDLNTGKVVWEHGFNVFLTDIVHHRAGWANLAADPETGYIYAHGIQGMMFCFDKDGKIIWSRSLTEELGRISGYGGRTHSPIIEGELVIISSLTSSWGAHAKGAHRFFGMDKRTGAIKWIAAAGEKPMDTTYSVPVTATLDGARVMFTGLADGSVAALRTTTGETLWRVPLSQRGIMSSVLYGNGRVYAVHGSSNIDSNIMGRLVCLDARNGKEIWRVDGLAGHYASPAMNDGLLFVASNAANLHCIDADSGKVYWTFDYGNEAKGSPVYADGKIYVGEVPGAWHILEVDKNGCKRLSEQRFEGSGGVPDEVFATAAVGHGRVVMATLNSTYCISMHDRNYRAEGKKDELGKLKKPGPTVRIQIEPAEAVVAPGGKIAFAAKGFDAQGIPTGTAKASYVLKDLQGSIGDDGVFTARGNQLQAGSLTAQSGGLTASARVRIVPPIPYEEDFESLPEGLPPAGWITSKLKCQVSLHDGRKVLRKLADRPSPPFARLRCYMMPPVPAGYTVTSDILGVSKKGRFLPDMGLVNSRYLLILTGSSELSRKLRLVSWAPVPRILREVEFPWEGDTWYRVMLSVDVADGKGRVKAKVWQSGKKEPDDWTLVMDDPSPNDAGSPGLYAYSVAITSKSKGTEVLFDNVAVTPNK